MIDLNDKKNRIIISGFLIVFIIVCLSFCAVKIFNRADVIYADERADTGFGVSLGEYKENIIKIDVEGAVKRPGLKVLKGDRDRLDDAIKAAGGLKRNADSSQINLAMSVCDGMKVVIPYIGGEAVFEYPDNGRDGVFAGKINVNTATAQELQKIPGIGPSYAARIIEYRENIGYFSRPEDLLAIKGIGEKRLANMKRYIKFR